MSGENNLDDVELKLLLAVEKHGDNGCYFPSLVQAVGLSETKVKYYLDRLTDDRKFLDWFGNMNPNIPDRYTLTRKGRNFLVEGNYI